jgi:FkbM family methyltransferase
MSRWRPGLTKKFVDEIEFWISERVLSGRFRAKKSVESISPQKRYLKILHELGVLNYQNDRATGERAFLHRYLNTVPAAVVVDVGAHQGTYSKLVLEIAPKATVHAFEPHPVTFLALKKINMPHFVAHQLAMGERQDTLALFDYDSERGSEHASVYRDVFNIIHKKPTRTHRVVCETLDRIIGALGIDYIDLLKIDTEGHELSVLKGAKTLIAAGKIGVIQFEFNEMNVISRTFFKDFFDLLTSYKFYRLLPDGALPLLDYNPVFHEIFAFQNIVCVHEARQFSFDDTA